MIVSCQIGDIFCILYMLSAGAETQKTINRNITLKANFKNAYDVPGAQDLFINKLCNLGVRKEFLNFLIKIDIFI